MPEETKDVNTSESSTEETEVKETEAEETAAATSEQETTETTETQQQTQEQGQAQEAVDGFGVPWKNRAMEWQRKFQETTESIPRLVEETLSKQQPKQQQYTIAQLEQYAIEHPQYRPWVEEEKAKIIQSNVAKATEERVKESETKQKEETIRQQSYQWVINHPRLQECLITNTLGQKVFNNAHPLAQMIGMYMQQKDIKDRPDAFIVASKLALSDYLDYRDIQNQTKNKKLQQSLKKVQKQTLIEGGGTKPMVVSKDAFQKAKQQLAKTGSKQDAKVAVKEYLKTIGVVVEE